MLAGVRGTSERAPPEPRAFVSTCPSLLPPRAARRANARHSAATVIRVFCEIHGLRLSPQTIPEAVPFVSQPESTLRHRRVFAVAGLRPACWQELPPSR